MDRDNFDIKFLVAKKTITSSNNFYDLFFFIENYINLLIKSVGKKHIRKKNKLNKQIKI